MKAGYRVSEGGVVHAPPAERYELLMRHRAGRDVRAVSGNFDALLDLRAQSDRPWIWAGAPRAADDLGRRQYAERNKESDQAIDYEI